MYVGGAAGAHVRRGDLLCTVEDPDAAMLMTGRFIQHYRDDDRERLDIALERSLAAYRDPWLEGREPVVAHQFQTTIDGRPG